MRFICPLQTKFRHSEAGRSVCSSSPVIVDIEGAAGAAAGCGSGINCDAAALRKTIAMKRGRGGYMVVEVFSLSRRVFNSNR